MYPKMRELGITPERRSSKTLANWWRQLNCWEWPKELGEPEDCDTPGRPRRDALMKEIIEVLGVRKMHEEYPMPTNLETLAAKVREIPCPYPNLNEFRHGFECALPRAAQLITESPELGEVEAELARLRTENDRLRDALRGLIADDRAALANGE